MRKVGWLFCTHFARPGSGQMKLRKSKCSVRPAAAGDSDGDSSDAS